MSGLGKGKKKEEKKEETKRRILAALAEKRELSYNQLARETRISRRILGERLRELVKERRLIEEIRREGRGPPKVVYRLTKDVVEELKPMLDELKFFHNTERIVSNILAKVKSLRENGLLSPAEATEKINKLVGHAVSLILLSALGRKPIQDEALELVVAAEPIRVIKKIFSAVHELKDKEIQNYLAPILENEWKQFKELVEKIV
jgi:DNA-binding HxlR family transcriptional regulator